MNSNMLEWRSQSLFRHFKPESDIPMERINVLNPQFIKCIYFYQFFFVSRFSLCVHTEQSQRKEKMAFL